MNTYKTSNVPLKDFVKFLEMMGAKQIRITGGHYIYSHRKLRRPIPIQSHIDPVPNFIVLEVLNYFDISSQKMWEMLGKTKGTTERKSTIARRGKRSKNNK